MKKITYNGIHNGNKYMGFGFAFNVTNAKAVVIECCTILIASAIALGLMYAMIVFPDVQVW